MTDAATKRIDDAVSAGTLTKDQGDKLKARLGDAIAKFVGRVTHARTTH